MRAAPILAAVLATVLLAAPALGAGLYEARSIVTGMDLRARPEGLRQALGQVLAKVSGQAALATDPRLAQLDPKPLLAGIAYLDRMSDQPKRDEQGTRDRPYDLVARFDPAAVDALLRAWGAAPWTTPRPTLAVDVAITPRLGPAAPLRADTDPDERHRAALLDAADRMGLDLVIPAAADPVPPPAGAPVLSGALRWSDADGGWVSTWRMGGAEWGLRGTGFDAAYRDGIAGAAAALAGLPHARP